MTGYLGDHTSGDTVEVFFTTSDSAGAAVAPSTIFDDADVQVYETGTDIPLTAGITVTSPVNSVVGLHKALIVASTGNGYNNNANFQVVLNPSDETVDSQTVVAVIGSFSIENRFAGVDADWVNGGRLDLILDAILADTGTDGVIVASLAVDSVDAAVLATDAAQEIADQLLDRTAGVETSLTLRQWLRLGASALFNKGSGLETTTGVYRDFGDTKDRITATIDADGNRTAVTTDAT